MNKWYALVFVTLCISSCALFESFDEIPMFIEIDSVSVETESGQGTSRHDIIDIWPSVDGQTIGVFEIPITFPVLDDDGDDVSNLFYQAGIDRLGRNNDHIIYPFFDRIEIDRAFIADTTIRENLAFTYKDETNFRLVESFEVGHSFTLDVDQDTSTFITITDADCLEGTCGLIQLTPENPSFSAATTEAFLDIPVNSTPVYIEMEYKTDINLSVGLQSNVNGIDFEQFFVTMTPTETWNKVYIEVTDILTVSQLESYRLLLGAVSTLSEDAEIRIDNIKLLHF